MYKEYGSELHTRQMIERLSNSLADENHYLLDMKGVLQVSRSAADELYNLTHSTKTVEIINLEPLVDKMLSAVTLGRFLPRKHPDLDISIINCKTIEAAIEQLAV